MTYPGRNKNRDFFGAITAALLLFLPQLVNSQTAETFDINRFSTLGQGVFETFYVEEVQTLQAVLDSGLLSTETLLLVTDTADGKLALVRDQMAFHHIAQGKAAGLVECRRYNHSIVNFRRRFEMNMAPRKNRGKIHEFD